MRPAKYWYSFFVLGLILLSLYAYNHLAATVELEHKTTPKLLSEWNLFQYDDSTLSLNEGVIPYDINTPLFSDYANKFRTIWMPEGVAASFSASGDYQFPDGTIISKTFYYPKSSSTGRLLKGKLMQGSTQGEFLSLQTNRLIETRLLVKSEDKWLAYPYVWNEQQSEAVLIREGEFIDLILDGPDGNDTELTYVVPDVNQCAGCHAENHTRGEIKPIGVKTRHLNKTYRYQNSTNNQLSYWHARGYLSDFADNSVLPQNAAWDKPHQSSLVHRARSYLDINCGHCHNPSGAADTSGLHLNIDNQSMRALGRCKLPVAAGRGSGGRSFSIVPSNAEESIIVYRTNSRDPAIMMPELGRTLVHEEGVSLLSQWIEQMDGDCN